MKTYLRVLLWMLAGMAVAGGAVLLSGIVPIKASSGHWRVTEWILRLARDRSVGTHSLGVKVPNLRDPALLRRGAGHYELACRSCHGAPGRAPSVVVEGMTPRPPLLMEFRGREEREEGKWFEREGSERKLFYLIKHGVKFTGMPGWPTQERDDEVWGVAAFVKALPRLDEARYGELAGTARAQQAGGLRVATGAAREAWLARCVGCHGEDGQGNGQGAFPLLAGQSRDYLRAALEAFASGHRNGGTMKIVAANLTEEERDRASDYFSSLPAAGGATPSGSVSTEVPAPSTRGSAERGRLIAQEGVYSQRVPACVECHGPGARRGKPAYPHLAGQPASYLELQLTLFREGRRGGGDHAHLMAPVAVRLTDEQIRDVAAYFASLEAR